MSKRYMVLGLSLVLALALSVPALGGPTNPIASISASVKSVANQALKKAKAAQKTANAAQTAANAAQSDATAAGSAAKGAQSTANEAKKKAESAQTTANTALSTANSAVTNANSRLKTTEFVSGSTTEENTTAFKVAAVECAAGQQVTGGGFGIAGTDDNEVTVNTEGSAFYGPGWLVTAEAIAGKTPTWGLQAIAVCAHP